MDNNTKTPELIDFNEAGVWHYAIVDKAPEDASTLTKLKTRLPVLLR